MKLNEIALEWIKVSSLYSGLANKIFVVDANVMLEQFVNDFLLFNCKQVYIRFLKNFNMDWRNFISIKKLQRIFRIQEANIPDNRGKIKYVHDTKIDA